MELREKLLKIQTELKCNKGQYNSFGKYSYRSCEDILEAVKSLLLEYKTTLTIEDELADVSGRVFIEAIATLQDCESESVISNKAYAELDNHKGMSLDQCTGTASSYARKYALNGLFLIDDTKDADTNEFVRQTNPMNKEIAMDYEITFGKYKGSTLGELLESNPDYIDWIINNSKDERLLQAIETLTGKTKLSENELFEKANLVTTIIGYETKGVDIEKIKETYSVDSIADMTLEQMNDCLTKLKKKYGE